MTVTEPKFINGEWTICIQRRCGTSYNARSIDKQSIIDYRNELLEMAKARTR